VGLSWLIGIPVLLVVQFLITIGACLAVSVINVYFYDFQFIVAFLLTMLFWLTPIVYQFDTVPETYRFLFMYFNPLIDFLLAGTLHVKYHSLGLARHSHPRISGYLLCGPSHISKTQQTCG
jgi:hypothetical protein